MIQAIEQIEAALNRQQQWLTITPEAAGDGTVRIVASINGHFATVAASDSVGDVAGAIVTLFNSMALEVKRAASDVVGDCAVSHPAKQDREGTDFVLRRNFTA